MIESMTGFATAETTVDGYTARVTLRSVNHRHLDIRMHLPESLRIEEDRWSELIRRRLRRGRVEANLQIERRKNATDLTFDRELVQRLAEEIRQLEAQGLVSGGIRGGDLLAWGQALQAEAISVEQKPLLDLVDSCFGGALDELIAVRRQEGARLAGFLGDGLERIRELAAGMIERRAQVEAGLAQEFRRRLAELGATEVVGEERVALEVAAAIDKASITEETDRLVAHCDHFRGETRRDAASGRKLDFIVQEMFRELNTIAAKARDSDLVHLAIEGKSVCEDLREQLRNVA